tara:strand:+ start:26920 stop:28302 length:1383 start_codon:yes stop_codon:yes gene_type:complete
VVITKTIFSNLFSNREYFKKVFPYLKNEYFENPVDRAIFKLIKQHVIDNRAIPSPNAIKVAFERSDYSEKVVEEAFKTLRSLEKVPEDLEWIVKETEKFCKEMAMDDAIKRSIEIQNNAEKEPSKRDKRIPDIGTIPELMQKALAVSFDSSIGMDWNEDYVARFKSYQDKADKIPFKLDILNRITKGGVERGTLNIILAGVNVGKSLGMCSLATDYILDGWNVLYITMEMSEEMVGKRIDANMIDVDMDDFDTLTESEFIKRLKRKNIDQIGKLKVKRYPTGGANCNHFRNLLDDLRTKQDFKPDVVMVDYLGICSSSRMRYSENSYTLVKAIAEEVRGLAVEYDYACWSGAQLNREGAKSSDVDMTDTAESFGLPATADFMLAGVETDELAQMGVQLFKQVKSRYGDKNKISKFKLGVLKGRQRWYEKADPEQEAQVEKDDNTRRSKMDNIDGGDIQWN